MNAAPLRSPIVLTHGLLGYDELRVYGWTVAQYFPQIPELLTAAGNRVFIARVSPTEGIAERARQLKAFIEQNVPDEPIHLIGHSMGGLDCRYLTSKLDMAERVLSLTTIGTPHRGTTFADWGVRNLERYLRPLLQLVGIPHQAFYDLTTDQCRAFNDAVLDVPHVRYFSVAGHYEGSWRTPEWQLPQMIVTGAEGPNDGIVSVASATWGEQVNVWDCDHLGLVNWPNRVLQACGLWKDRTAEYAALTHRLAAAGF